ncbi:hypothetical protein F0562_001754 [Nyssa sinensis]|uniref:Uncharacterized protein n=1 Tax=Nyssa sinensis TaxID=561372 RepID=A0A5J5C7W3_9ASTE|nr:hypothetical protein F0562_001754 [Nyssa sinensis]
MVGLGTMFLNTASDDTLDPVLDIEGNELQAAESYYALPLIWALGGGLTVARNINGTICPLNVVQALSEVDNGRPLKFSAIMDKEDVIRESTPLDIQFSTTTICPQSTVWTVNGAFITTGGEGGSIISNFRIQKSNELSFGKTYKFVYCFARMACQDIGRSEVNGRRPLTLMINRPWEVVFVKAAVEGSKIRKITAG